MPANQTPREFAAAVINDVKNNINQAPAVPASADAFAAICNAQAGLAIAAALLEVADAIRSDGTGSAIERAMNRLTEAVRDGVGRRET